MLKKLLTYQYLTVVLTIIALLLLTGCAAQALQALRQAAEKGDAQAQYKLGFNYEAGIDVPKDLQQARKWYLLSAAQGNKLVKSQFNQDRSGFSSE